MILLLIGILFFPLALAQPGSRDDDAPAQPTLPAPPSTPDLPALPDPTVSPMYTKPQGVQNNKEIRTEDESYKEFNPSESISEDTPVAFPADI